MQDSEMVDRLAELCRLSERGYFKWGDGWWGKRPMDEWRPDESDDDCRVVLERFYEQTSSQQLSDFLDELANIAAEDHNRTKTWSEFLLLATPAEKCAAVLKVLGDDA